MENFSFEIIELCNTKGHLSFREVELQWEYKVLSETFEDGTPAWYNKNIGAIKFRCDGHTEEVRRKMREFRHTKEMKQQMSETRKGENNAFYGKTHTDESKKQMSKTKKGVPLSEEHKQKLKESASHKGKYGNQHPKSKVVVQIDKDTDTPIASWLSMSLVQKELGICASNISAICRNTGKAKTAGGFKWRYAEL